MSVMIARSSRRKFLKRAALTGGALAAARIWPVNILEAREPSDLLNCVQVGCGGRANTHLKEVIINRGQHLVALVDPDPKQLAQTKKWLANNGQDVDKVQTFDDYRVMFDKIGKQ